MNYRKLVPYVLSALSGAIWFLACPPYPFWWAGWFAMVPMFFALRGRKGKEAFFIGLAGGFVAMMGGFPWITDLIVKFGSLPWIVAFPICALYNLYQGIIFGLFALLFTWFRDNTRIPVWLSSALVAASVEYVFPLIFPWYFAITQAYVPHSIQIAEFTGPIGVSSLILMSSGLIFNLYVLFRTRKFEYHIVLPLVIILAVLGWSHWRISDIEKLEKKSPVIGVAMIQPMMGIHPPGERYFAQKQLLVHQKLSSETENLQKKGEIDKLDLIVWSESSYPYHISRDATGDFSDPPGRYDMRKIRRGFTTPIFMGVATTSGKGDDKKVYNSAILMDREGKITHRYDKNWLLMFGEYIPFYDYMPFLHDFFKAHRMSNMSRGTSVENLVLGNVKTGNSEISVKLGPMICYEDILPEYSNRLKKHKPNILVNITNDAWFGATQEPFQHFALAIFRTVETRLPMIRNVNIGISAFVSAAGKVGVHVPSGDPISDPQPRVGGGKFLKELNTFKLENQRKGVWKLTGWPSGYIVYDKVPVMEHRSTFFTTFGNLFSVLSLLFVSGVILKKKRDSILKLFRKKSEKSPEISVNTSEINKDSIKTTNSSQKRKRKKSRK